MAASTYDEALARLLAHEGGYVNHPSDPGGPTKYGITLATLRAYAKPGATAADVKAMPVEDARAIYRAKYWNALRCDQLPAGLDYAVFDYGVNSGVARAAKVLRALLGGAAAGGVDQTTLALAQKHNAKNLIGALCDERLAFLKRLKTWPVFGRGWSRRVAQVRATATAMADIRHTNARQPVDAAATHSAPTGGKGVVPVNRTAQRGTSGAVVATGVAAAERAQASGAASSVIVTIMLAAIALAICGWLFWRWRQRRAQMRIASTTGNKLFPAALPEREQRVAVRR